MVLELMATRIITDDQGHRWTVVEVRWTTKPSVRPRLRFVCLGDPTVPPRETTVRGNLAARSDDELLDLLRSARPV